MTQSTKQQDRGALPAIVSADPVGRMLANRGFSVKRVDPAEYTKSVELSEDQIDELVLRQLENEGFINAQEAFKAISGTFGISKFSNKVELAQAATPFYIHEIVQRIDGGFKKDDDWALKIAIAETGEMQTLSLESNPGRDRFLYLLAYAMKKNPKDPPLAVIDRIEKSDGNAFYILGPASIGQNNLRHVGASIIEHEPVAV
jgi:hypothetical protein